jgi:hypothetical protein
MKMFNQKRYELILEKMNNLSYSDFPASEYFKEFNVLHEFRNEFLSGIKQQKCFVCGSDLLHCNNLLCKNFHIQKEVKIIQNSFYGRR